MTVKNHSEVVKGSRHAPHNLEYTNSTNREAGTNEASGITLSADNVYQVARQTGDDSFWILLNHSPITWLRLRDGSVVSTYSGEDVEESIPGMGLVRAHDRFTLADDAEFDLPSYSGGFARILAGPVTGASSVECLHICWGSDGAPIDLGSTTNTALADTDTNLCAYDNGTKVTIKNRLGSTKAMIFEIHYYNPVVV
jgi:hypothetical protein